MNALRTQNLGYTRVVSEHAVNREYAMKPVLNLTDHAKSVGGSGSMQDAGRKPLVRAVLVAGALVIVEACALSCACLGLMGTAHAQDAAAFPNWPASHP